MDNLKKLLLSGYVVLVTGVLLVWMHQDSLETYWQQSYHSPPPWQSLKTVPVWQAGSRVHTATALAWQTFRVEITGETIPMSTQATQATQDLTAQVQPECACAGMTKLAANQVDEAENQFETAISPPVAQFKPHATISVGQRVFFAGDSMMQGVAPHLAVRLRREYGLSSLDLSRQSTGLAYPKSFNWPATISKTLADNPDIKLLAIFLGPNDPWDMPSGQGGKYLRFASPEWEALYRSRIRDIISSAQRHDVDVIWVSSPYMRGKKLSDQVSYLNELYESEVLQAGEVFLSSNQVFQYSEATYSDYMGDGSLKQKMRAGDGIHFTTSGQRTLADALFELIVFTPEKQVEHETQFATNTLN
ncbi:SGNH/GDSL hydrolase family protein [Oceanisphaera sp. W20_SRM_FM3]|uniref:SGNH/GDSL hydrolase family protein n=1 Tax=Oceanisphaera sp. W20_SRM_FM3 TaxID=3240267 RepID=UPI003F9BDDEE